MGFWFGFDTGFDIMQVFVFAIFAIVIVCFNALEVKGIGTWHTNDNSPRVGDLTFQGTRYLGFDRHTAGAVPEAGPVTAEDVPPRYTEKKSWDPEL